MKTKQDLVAALDADRGFDPWTGGPRATLRAILSRPYEPTFPGDATSRWAWLRGLTGGALEAHRAGQWMANELDAEASAAWEIARRALDVGDAEVRALLFPFGVGG